MDPDHQVIAPPVPPGSMFDAGAALDPAPRAELRNRPNCPKVSHGTVRDSHVTVCVAAVRSGAAGRGRAGPGAGRLAAACPGHGHPSPRPDRVHQVIKLSCRRAQFRCQHSLDQPSQARTHALWPRCRPAGRRLACPPGTPCHGVR